MGTSNISSIGKVFAGGQVVNGSGQVQAQDEDIKVAFTEVMSQMSTMVGSGFSSENQQMNLEQDAVKTQGVADREYDRYQRCEMSIKSSSKSDWGESDQVTEEMEKFAEDVNEVLKEELGVSEEQIQEAMETLGIGYGDLMNPNQLAALVMQLTGTEDASALLCNGEFLNVLQSVGALTEDLLKELGLTAEELTQMLGEMQSMADELQNTTEGMNVTATNSVGEEVTAEASTGETQEAQIVTTKEQTAEALENDVQTDITNEDESMQNVDDEESDLVLNEEVEDKTNNAGKDNAAFSGGRSSGDLNAQTSANQAVSANQQVSDMAMTQETTGMNSFSTQLDVSNIIKQIVEYSRVNINNSATTMEMQLNPENLGKLYLEVTSKNGVVSAHITAQNEAVKEVLESQIVELRQNMNQAGVKVEAVEVTVGSHEFEKNLEQNAKQEEKQAEEQEKAAKQTRRINLNDLDELGGLMTEEENLVAQMMADQGNSVDFTA